jgi:hypothetical protein
VGGTVCSITYGPPVSTEKYEKEKEEQDRESGKVASASQDKGDGFVLYVCGNGCVFMLNPSKPSNSLVDVLKMVQRSHHGVDVYGCESHKGNQIPATDVHWAPDFSLLAIGYTDGYVTFQNFFHSYLPLPNSPKCRK